MPVYVYLTRNIIIPKVKKISLTFLISPIFLFFFLTSTICSLQGQELLAGTTFMNGEEIPLFAGNIINDTFGFEFDGEWDDGLSFGLGTGVIIPQWNLSVMSAFNGYTFRGTTTEEGKRVDGLETKIAWYGADFDTPAGEFWLIPGLGCSFLGDFGGYFFQTEWHNIAGVKRLVPSKESCEDFHFVASTNLAFYWDIPVIPLIPGGEFYIDTQLNVIGKVSLSLGEVKPYGNFLLSFYWSGGWYGGEDLYSLALKEKREWGLDLRMRMGGLYAVSEVDLTTGCPTGTIGVILNPGGFPNYEGLFKDTGQSFSIAMTVLHQSTIYRWAWDLEHFFPAIEETPANNLLRLRVGMQGGANSKPYYSGVFNGVSEDLNYRFLEIYGGVEVDFLRNPDFMFAPYIYTDAGYRSDMEKSYRSTEAVLMSKREGAFLSVGAGIRFTPTFFILGQAPYKYFIEVETGADFPLYQRVSGEPVIFRLSAGVGCRI